MHIVSCDRDAVPPKYPLACQKWTNFTEEFPTRDYSQAKKTNNECRDTNKWCFAVFNGKDWEAIPACTSAQLKFDFLSGYCLCKDNKAWMLEGGTCSEKEYDENQDSDIFNHFYHQQFIYAKQDNPKPSPEVLQSLANLQVLKGDYTNMVNGVAIPGMPDIRFQDNNKLNDKEFITLEMSLDKDSKATTSQFEIYVAK